MEHLKNTENLKYWLALMRTPNMTYRRFASLFEAFGDVKSIFDAAGSLQSFGYPQALVNALKRPDWKGVKQDLLWLESNDLNHFICCTDDLYPRLLSETGSRPLGLFLRGDIGCLSAQQISIVGSRNPTASGKQNAYDFSRHMSEVGLVVTSGLALGIDAMAHRGALDVKSKTIAVTGCSLERVYPASNKRLAAEIIANGGLLVSEYSFGTQPEAKNFPRRNRIISGLSLGTLVIEANVKSGSLITAYQALEQGREVFAIPGSIHNPLSRGCHKIIRDGAKLVETADDILIDLESLAEFNSQKKTVVDSNISDEALRVLDLLDSAPTEVDLIIQRSNFSSETVSNALVELEVEELVEMSHGGFIKL